jgi:hypothetical protein
MASAFISVQRSVPDLDIEIEFDRVDGEGVWLHLDPLGTLWVTAAQAARIRDGIDEALLDRVFERVESAS